MTRLTQPAERLKKYWRKGIWQRLICLALALLIFSVAGMYGIAQWYIHSERSKPLEFGVSFIPDYAQYLGVDPQANMDALTAIGVKHFRLVSYWSDIEQTPGQYDFSQLDWQFKKAEDAHAKITLTLGLRQPRWPECHMPDWANQQPASIWQPKLYKFMQAVVNRYHDSPALENYQLENEYFLGGFGICNDTNRGRLIHEYNLVKQADPTHQVIVSRSNNDIGFPTGQPQPDVFGISIYRRVWDAAFTHRYLEHPQPAWYYAFLAGWQKIFLHRDMIISELQAEAWAPNLKSVKDVSLPEQNKSLDARRMNEVFDYGKATGMRQIYMWGSEYWYYRMQVLHDPSLWQVAKKHFGKPT